MSMVGYRYGIHWFAGAALFLIAVSVHHARATAGEGSIQGLVYVSYFGDLDVMAGSAVEVSLLKSAGSVEENLAELKQKRIAQLRAQEAVAVKAHAEARRAVGKEEVKEKRDLLKRESDAFDKLRFQYEKEVDLLVANHAVTKTKSDGEGKFRFESLTPGRYFVSARFAIHGTDSRFFWLHAVNVERGAVAEAQLTKTTAYPLY